MSWPTSSRTWCNNPNGRRPPTFEPGRIIDARDPSELAAERVTETITAGDAASTKGIGTLADSVGGPSGGAVVQRWGLGDVWDDVTDAASTVGSGIESAGSAVVSGAESAGSALSTGYEKATDFRGMANTLNKGVDWVEGETSAGMDTMVDAAKGIPVVSQLAQSAAWAENAMVDVTGGAVKGAGDLASGVGGAIAHPLDTAGGVEGMLEHGPSAIPFVGTTLKGIHGAYDLAVHGGGQYGNSWGDLAHHLNPLQQSDDDATYMGAVGKGIVAPGDEKEGGGWQRWLDNPIEATARAATNIAPALVGAGAAGGPVAAGDAAAAAADTAGATAAAADATDVTNAAAKAADAADASSGAVKPAAAAGPQTVEDMIQDFLGNAQSSAEGSKPLTTDGTGRYAPVVEANEPTPPPAASGESSAPPAAAPAPSGQGWLARKIDALKDRFGRSDEPTSPPPDEAQSDQDVAERFYRQQFANTDGEVGQVKLVRSADQGYGPRPIK